MFPNVNPTHTPSWKNLVSMARTQPTPILQLLEKDTERTKRLSFYFKEFLFDFSKNQWDKQVISELLKLAQECQLKKAIEALFEGEKINRTENRAVLHTALRRTLNESPSSSAVKKELHKIKQFEQRLSSGEWRGCSGKKITDIVNIGIGGSDLGPKMVTYALKPYWHTTRPHFVSNVDAHQLIDELEGLNPETTLFIIASKTFTTQETMTNAHSAKEWFLKNSRNKQDIANHFVAVSTNTEAVKSFGIKEANMFTFWDWVGGRYSLWSAIGISIVCSIGFNGFEELLKGAEQMDIHFRNTEFSENIPVIAALLGIWYHTFLGFESHAILPYDHRLRFLPSYLQQADMESNGKCVDRNRQRVNYQTGPIIWGEPGTNGQHAFYQLLHQGTKMIPCDFIASVNAAHELQDHHYKLLAHFFAQPEALLKGKTAKEVKSELEANSEKEIAKLLPYKLFEGNRPSTSILMKELTPYNLGMLIAFYEHKIFTQGAIWNIYSFDQWGVELGKQLAIPILNEMKNQQTGNHDTSTSCLMKYFQDNLK